jgi:hypothetical protein
MIIKDGYTYVDGTHKFDSENLPGTAGATCANVPAVNAADVEDEQWLN